MQRPLVGVAQLVLLAPLLLAACVPSSDADNKPNIEVRLVLDNTLAENEGFDASMAVDGRLLLMLSRSNETEPRFQVGSRLNAIPIFGVDATDVMLGEPTLVDSSTFGFPVDSLADLEAGEYWAQGLFHRYDTFNLASGKTVKLPMDRGEGQQWRRAPGNVYSTPQKVQVRKNGETSFDVILDQIIPPITPPEDTEWIKHVQIKSEMLSEFWGRDMTLGAHVLLPKGFDEHPEARYPLMIFHGHFPDDFGGFQTEPPAPDLECVRAERFQLDCYNRVVQQEAYDFYKQWTSDDFPRFIVLEIQHPNPYYDDSYAVNSANLGPYGDAITHELIPHLEDRFRGLGEGWSRFLYGGSTGGWEALAAQVFYPDEYGGSFAACPDPIDFRAYSSVNLYEDDNAYFYDSDFKPTLRPGWRNSEGRVEASLQDFNALERVLGSKGRSGDQFDIWQAVYSPMGNDGYPVPIWDKETGKIDHEVAEYWKENYDLRHILERDWATLGPKLEGKIHIYCGDMDNYYLNNAVVLMEEFLEETTNPPYGGEVAYGDGDEHCWNGAPDLPNAISRLRYNTLYLPRILELIETKAPAGADTHSWRY